MRNPSDRNVGQDLVRTTLLTGIVLVMLLSGALLAVGVALPTGPSSPRAVAHATPPGFVTVLPPAKAPPHAQNGQVVNPTSGYSAEPAPMGIADFGVSGSTGYTYGTDQWLGNFSWTKICISGCSGSAFTVQLNVVLQFVQGGTTYDFWIQDVAEPTSNSGNSLTMAFLDNIWNFSGSFAIPGTTLSGNGSIYTYGSDNYYEYGPVSGLPGATSTLAGPNYFYLLALTHLNSQGIPVVIFAYNDGSGWVGYDTVTFNFAKSLTSFDGFFVNGDNTNGAGLFTDGELDMGGPGGGSSTSLSATSTINEQLEYWNGHNFENTPAAWNFGGDTGETISSVQSIFSQDGRGTPQTDLLNGTTRDAAPAQAYTESQVGTLVLWVPSLTSGTIAVDNKGWAFNYGWSKLTLLPGTYSIWANATGGASNYLGLCTVTAATLTNVTLAAPCAGGGHNPTVSVPSASKPTADVGQTITFTSVVGNPGTAPDTYAWSVTPSTGLGCTLANALSITCLPTESNTYSLSITITDSKGNTSTSTLTGYIVHPDPTVAVPTVAPLPLQVGTAATFTSSLGLKGAGGDSYAWSEAPSTGLGCAASITLTLACTPVTAGTYVVTITVTDSAGGAGSNSTASLKVTPPLPTVSVPVASPHSSTDVGVNVTFTSTVTSTGSGGDSYAWSSTPSGLGCAASTALTVVCDPTTAGTYTVTIVITDSSGSQGWGNLTGFVVYADPTVSGPTAAPSAIDVSQSVTFTASALTSGSGGDTWSWVASGGLGCPASTTTSVTCTPTAAGTFTAKAVVTDSNGGKGSGTLTYVVTPAPTVAAPVPSPAAVSVSQTVTFTATVTNPGSGGDAFTWSVAPSTGLGCGTSTNATLVCTPTATGTYVVSVTIKDSAGLTSSASSAPLTVSAYVPLTGSASANVTSGPAALSVAFVGTAAGGTPTYAYAWRFGDGGSAVGAQVTHVFSSAGTYTVWFWVNDSAGHSVSAQVVITVSAPPAPPPQNPTGTGGFLSTYWWLLVVVAAVAVVGIAAVAYGRRKKGAPEPGWDTTAPAPAAGTAYYGTAPGGEPGAPAPYASDGYAPGGYAPAAPPAPPGYPPAPPGYYAPPPP